MLASPARCRVPVPSSPLPLLAFGAAVSFAGCADAGPAQAAKRSVPQGFIGANTARSSGGPGSTSIPSSRVMASAGVESVRTGFFWSDLQPYRTAADVPAAARSRFQDVGGVPTDFTFTDRCRRRGGGHGIGVLPVVVTAPAWARRDPSRSDSAPQGTANYARLRRR